MEARTALTAVVKEKPDNYFAWTDLAIVLAQLGERDAHRQLTHEMIARFGGSTDLTALSCTANASMLFPLEGVDGADLAAVVHMAGKVAAEGGTSTLAPHYEFDVSLVRYRTGDFRNAAAPLLQRGENYPPTVAPGASALLALAQHRLGQTAEARATLIRAEVLADEKLPKPGADLGGAWREVLVSQMLLREARKSIGEK